MVCCPLPPTRQERGRVVVILVASKGERSPERKKKSYLKWARERVGRMNRSRNWGGGEECFPWEAPGRKELAISAVGDVGAALA